MIEIMIVIVILGILASMVIPRFLQSDRLARETIMASTTRYVRQMVQYHKQAGDVDVVASGYPEDIDAAWFRGSVLPEHTWTGKPMVIDVVDGDVDAIYPAGKTFDPLDASAANAWYNRTNGAFCVMVPAQDSDGETLDAFNAANNGQAGSLADTTN